RLIQSVFTSDMIEERRMIAYLLIGTIPAAVAGVLLGDYFEQAFSSPSFTSVMLLVTGGILLATRLVHFGTRPLSALSGLLIGIGQALAILPGISRSGTTIAVGMFSGVEPSKATEFSFLLAVPAIAGALVFKLDEISTLDAAVVGPFLAGAIGSFLTSLLAVYTVLTVVRKGRFYLFGLYCFVAGGVGLYLFL
ncbi:MAG: undecaprenyl-diphosphate phosphatase, partial [Candidatus Zixiibacteriota bacterium]